MTHDLASRIDAIVQEELERGHVRSAAVALVDDQCIVHAAGHGIACAQRGLHTAPDTLHRVGSISKLFNALLIAQLVDAGKVELDAPVSRYDPSLRFVDAEGRPHDVTLRQLLCHRSGMARESPTGSYFDACGTTMNDAVRSIATVPLIARPGGPSRYSNIGATVAGYIAQRITGEDYPTLAKRMLLEPMGMHDAGFTRPTDERMLATRVAAATMRIAQADGAFAHGVACPTFDIATIPAGNLYASARDLAQLAKLIFADGVVDGRRIVSPQTLHAMLTPQLTEGSTGFGLGFMVNEFAGRKSVSHNGAVYGFSSAFIALPEAEMKLAAIVLMNEDIAMGCVARVSHAILHAALAAKTGAAEPKRAPTVALNERQRDALIGDYVSTSYWARIETNTSGELQLVISGQPAQLRCTGDNEIEMTGRFLTGTLTFELDADGGAAAFTALRQHFERVDTGSPLPHDWTKYLGVYGHGVCPLIISARHGHLYAMTENMMDYHLTPDADAAHRFAFPPGMYEREHIVFDVDAAGRTIGMRMAGIAMPRRGDLC